MVKLKLENFWLGIHIVQCIINLLAMDFFFQTLAHVSNTETKQGNIMKEMAF